MQEAMWSYVEFYPIFYLKVMKVGVIRNFVIAKKKVNDNIISVRMQNIRLAEKLLQLTAAQAAKKYILIN